MLVRGLSGAVVAAEGLHLSAYIGADLLEPVLSTQNAELDCDMTTPVPTEEAVRDLLRRLQEGIAAYDDVVNYSKDGTFAVAEECHAMLTRLWEAHKAIEAYSKARIEVVEAGYADAMRRAEHAEKALKEARWRSPDRLGKS